MKFSKGVALLLATIPAIIADAPWFTLVTNTMTGPGFIRCGGVLVHPDIVLTAGECAYESSPDTVLRVGYRTDTDADFLVGASMVYNHPEQWVRNNRFSENLPHDLQLIKLNQTITGIEPIKLYDGCCGYDDDNTKPLYFAQAGSPTDIFDVPKEGFPVSHPPKQFKMGGAAIADSFHTTLKEGLVVTEEYRYCVNEYIDIPGYQAELDEGVQFCANSNTSSPCDSNAWGSPLYHNETGEPILVGLASQGECTPGGLPFVYTRIAHYYNFIRESICSMTSVSHTNTDCSEYTS